MAYSNERPNVSLLKIFISIAITIGAWIYSLTLLSPIVILLKISANFRNLFLSKVFPYMGKLMGKKLDPLRKKTLELLPTDVENMKILEIGVGRGGNFKFYPENCKVSLLDMDEDFEEAVHKTLEMFPSIKVEKLIVAMAENMVKLENCEFDIVICTHLLCSAQDLIAVLNEVNRVLKPGGKFIYMEHVGFPKNHIGYWIQAILSPLWCIYFNGCRLTRNSHTVISKYFSQNSYKLNYPPSLPLFLTPHVFGIATK